MSLATNNIASFLTYVSGVTFPNPDGTDRQKIIRKCKRCEQVDLVPEPDNKHDPNAVKVVRVGGRQVGYLPRDEAAEVSRDLKEGFEFLAFVHKILPPDETHPTYGMQLAVIRVPDKATDEEIQQYLDEL